MGGSGIGAQQGAEVLGAVLKKSSATPDKPPANNNEGEQEQRPGQEGDGDGNAGDIAADTTADEDAAEAAEVTADTVNAGEQAGVGVGEAIGEAIPGIGALVAAGATAGWFAWRWARACHVDHSLYERLALLGCCFRVVVLSLELVRPWCVQAAACLPAWPPQQSTCTN